MAAIGQPALEPAGVKEAAVKGRVAVVTGANTGIGKETAVGLARLGATTVLACRNQARAAAAADEVKARGASDDVHVVALDLADLASVKACAEELSRRFDKLHVLVNNAGGILGKREVTAQGIESTFGVNHLGPYYLTRLLLGRMADSAPARVVNVASFGHHIALYGMRFDNLQSDKGPYISLEVYGRSKLANVLFTRELARRTSGTGVTANCCHPGAVRTGFGMDGDLHGYEKVINLVVRPFEISPERGARTSIFLASADKVEASTGGYYAHSKPGHMSRQARSDSAAERLWDESEKLLSDAGFPCP
jgi:NAD(P)-dependent dehydrogenase (short-subunit alcohol dehydrogenase family)